MPVCQCKSPIGTLLIEVENACITRILFEGDAKKVDMQQAEYSTPASKADKNVLDEAIRQLTKYFAVELETFSLPLAPKGTSYMQKVWKLLQTVPYGKTASYKQIATLAGNSKASRAVGLANHRNPIPIIIPCHRIISSDGKLTGYAGGLDIKSTLLAIEGIDIK